MTTPVRKLAPAGLILLVALALPACGSPESSPTTSQAKPGDTGPAASPPRIETMTVSASQTPPILILGSKVTYAEDRFSRISSPLQGRVIEVRAKLGDHVEAGQILLVVDSPDIAAAYSDYVKEISELSLAKRNYELSVELYNVQAISLKDLKQAENDYNREKAEFKQAKEKLLILKVPAPELEKPLDQQNISSRFKLKSPLSGTVVERTVTPGQLVGGDPSQVLFTIADLDTLQVVADAYEGDLGLLQVGQVAVATVESAPGKTFPAAIAFIGDLVDPTTRTVKVRAWVNNEVRLLKPEMFARLNIPIGGGASFITVPTEAIVEQEGHLYVYVQDQPGHYVKREVTAQKIEDNRMRVLTGLAEGDTIVSKGAILVKAQQNGV
ncbi:efflux RND transporter periplasmic adaptor subunit [Nitrospira sp. Kam-Ns4a]